MVKIYTREGCGYCKVMEKLLERSGLEFEKDYDVKKIEGVFFSLPVIEVENVKYDFGDGYEKIKAMSPNFN